jgi:asparagine synthase (glutamine-hydrolysing)
MFAFAIWDEKEKTLFAARDRFGEKPFFYSLTDEALIFGSEMKAIWAAGTERSVNLKLLFNFITIGYVDNPEIPGETFFKNINKLPPASYLLYDFRKKELTLQNYWDIDLHSINKKITDEEAIEQFNELLNKSITRRLRSDVPIGHSLSGGLDSSAITAISKSIKAPNQTQKVFTAIFQDFEKDELAYSKQMAEKLHLQQYLANISATQLLTEWNELCHHQEEPIGSASVFAQYKLFELASKEGVKVLLDGQGADEILGGYHKYYKWYWQELFRNGKLLRSGEINAARKIGINEPFTLKNRIAAWFPGFASIVIERQYLIKAIGQVDLAKDFVHLQSKEAYYTPPEHFTLNGMLYFNTRTHGLEELLRCADRNAMAHGRELRLPYLSHELVEFVFSLPSSFKIRNGWTKWLLRESQKESLPANICWRKDKIGFEPPQKKWMEDPALQEAIIEAKKILVGQNILNPGVLQKPIVPAAAYDANNFDWRYFSAASLFLR